MAFETAKLDVINGALLRMGGEPLATFEEVSDRGTLGRQWVDKTRREALRAHLWNVALVRDQLNSFPQATLTPGAISGTNVLFTASAPVFLETDVRSRLVVGTATGGIARVRTFVDTQNVRADIETNLADVNPIAIESWRIAPAWRFDFRFPKPAGYLRVIEVEGLSGLTTPGSFFWSWWQHRDNSPEPVKAEGIWLVTDVGAKMNVQYIEDVENPALWDPNLANTIEALLAFRISYGMTGSLQAAKTHFDAYQQGLREARAADGQEGTADDSGSDMLIAVRM